MTAQISVVVEQVTVFAIIMAVGFIAARTNVVSKDGLAVLSRLIVRIILPALIFSIVAGSGVTAQEFLISGRFAVGTVCCFALLTLSGYVMSRFCRLKGTTANVFVAVTTFGNMGFMGIPLIQGIFREPVAQVCISVYTMVDMALLWTFGVYLCSRHQEDSNPLSAVRNMVNPTTVSLLVAFIVMIFRIPVPDLLMKTISGIGGTSKYLTLMYLGSVLAFISPGNISNKASIFLMTAVKMLLLPILVYYFLGFFLPQTPRQILTLIVGLPSMTTVVMVAAAYKSNDVYATEVIFVTTLASLITIPLVSVITGLM